MSEAYTCVEQMKLIMISLHKLKKRQNNRHTDAEPVTIVLETRPNEALQDMDLILRPRETGHKNWKIYLG